MTLTVTNDDDDDDDEQHMQKSPCLHFAGTLSVGPKR